MAEQTLFDGLGVTVTNKRLLVGQQTTVIASINSIRTVTIPPKVGGPLVVVLMGCFVSVVGLISALVGGAITWLVIGLFVLLPGVLWWISRKACYSIILTSSSGESTALTHRDWDFVSQVVGALNKAIVYGD